MKTFFTLLFLIVSVITMGQCPISFTSSSTQTAQCPSGGGISVTASGSGVTYRITSGPSGYPTVSNSTGNFTSLVPGTYTVEATNGSCTIATSLTVNNAYAAFSVSSMTSSNVCSSGITGGTINASVNGGKAPYQYDIVPVGNTPTYGGTTGNKNYSETVTTFGIYRIYARDACGEVRTQDLDLRALQPKPVDFWWEELLSNRPCAEVMDGLSTVTLNVHLIDLNGTAISFNDLLGSTYKIYKPSPANSITTSGANCSTALGAQLASGTIVSGNISPADLYSYPITIPQEDIIFTMTTKCGETFKYCYNFNAGAPFVPDALFDAIQQSCNAVWNNQVIRINPRYVYNMTPPITYLLTKNGGGTVTNNNGYFTGLTMANLPATVKLTDACGKTITKTIPKPIQGSALQATAEPEWQFHCSNVQNTATAVIRINGGDLQGIGDATNVTISGGTVTAVPGISSFQDWLPGYFVSNLLSGYTYKIRITNLCNEKDSIIFTVPLDQWGQPTLSWNLTATTSPLCGQNKGTITANSHFSGNEVVNYYLYNTNAPNTEVATNITGIFQDVTSGNYKIKFIAPNSSTDCPDKVIKDSINVTLLSPGVAQSINKKTVTTCEAANGILLSSGKAILEVNGAAPFTYEIIKTSLVGTGATEVWNVSSVNNASNSYTWDIPLAGDPSNTQYTLRSTDVCGNKITTQASLQPINTPTLTAGTQPCVGVTNYTFGVNPYGGAFTYRWVKLPDLATTISTQPTVTFPGAYTTANDGYYKCYISLTGCVSREIDVFITSSLCHSLLPVKLISLTGTITSEAAYLQWTTENQINFSGFSIERSTNGIDFSAIGSVSANNVSPIASYTYKDNSLPINASVYYYRLKMKDNNGNWSYSTIVKLSTKKDMNLSVFPNPVKHIASITASSKHNTEAYIKVIDNAGKMAYAKKINLTTGNNSITITDLNTLAKGVYIMELSISGQETERTKFIKD